MRLPIVSPIESRDGTVEKDALCKNLLIEQDVDAMAVLRPGLEHITTTLTASSGNGIVDFNGDLLSVFGSQLAIADIEALEVVSFETPFDCDNPEDSELLTSWWQNRRGAIVNGATVEGYSDIYSCGIIYVPADGEWKCFRWSETAEFELFLHTAFTEEAVSMSADGTLFVVGLPTDTSYRCLVRIPPDGVVETLYDFETNSGGGYIYGPTSDGNACIAQAGGGAQICWTNDGGVQEIPAGTTIYDIADTTKLLVGKDATSPIKLTLGQAPEALPSLGGTNPYIYRVTPDGTIGYGISGSPSRFCRWDLVGNTVADVDATATYTAPTLQDISDDGRYMVGYRTVSTVTKGFIFDYDTAVWTDLELPNQTSSFGVDCSSDGGAVVGYAVKSTATAWTKGWVWRRDEGISEISLLTGYVNFGFYSIHISDNGSSIAGVVEHSGLPYATGMFVLGGADVLPRFRSLVALEDGQMDFAQSTL